jgi:hypothetical protein
MKRKLQWLVVLVALAAMVQTAVVAASNQSKVAQAPGVPPHDPGV